MTQSDNSAESSPVPFTKTYTCIAGADLLSIRLLQVREEISMTPLPMSLASQVLQLRAWSPQ